MNAKDTGSIFEIELQKSKKKSRILFLATVVMFVITFTVIVIGMVQFINYYKKEKNQLTNEIENNLALTKNSIDKLQKEIEKTESEFNDLLHGTSDSIGLALKGVNEQIYRLWKAAYLEDKKKIEDIAKQMKSINLSLQNYATVANLTRLQQNLNEKANKIQVDSLKQKATDNYKTIQSLNNLMSQKVDNSTVTQLLENKADKTELDQRITHFEQNYDLQTLQNFYNKYSVHSVQLDSLLGLNQ